MKYPSQRRSDIAQRGPHVDGRTPPTRCTLTPAVHTPRSRCLITPTPQAKQRSPAPAHKPPAKMASKKALGAIVAFFGLTAVRGWLRGSERAGARGFPRGFPAPTSRHPLPTSPRSAPCACERQTPLSGSSSGALASRRRRRTAPSVPPACSLTPARSPVITRSTTLVLIADQLYPGGTWNFYNEATGEYLGTISGAPGAVGSRSHRASSLAIRSPPTNLLTTACPPSA